MGLQRGLRRGYGGGGVSQWGLQRGLQGVAEGLSCGCQISDSFQLPEPLRWSSSAFPLAQG